MSLGWQPTTDFDEGIAQNKIVVATGDSHYIRKDQKILRDVYISAQAIGGAHHPLYLYNKEKRAKQVTPDQRFFNTEEMLERKDYVDLSILNSFVNST